MTPRKLLGFLILNFAIAGIALQYFSVRLYTAHRIPAYCDGTVIHPLHDLLSRYQEADSWYPMMEASSARSSAKGIYQTVFFDHQIKFQYPLASLMPIDLLRSRGLSDYELLDTLKWMSIIVFLAQIPCLFLILRRAFTQPQSWPMTLALAVVLVISFYPLVRAYAAGQIQVLLDLLFSFAFLNWIDKKDRVSGFMIGIAVLVKPQYGLFLLWAALRKNWKFVIAAMLPVTTGTLLGIVFYGWKNNADYLSVIRYMGRHGEAYYPNQSVNGLLNRLLLNGSNTTFDVHGFAPFLPVVYYLTLLTSAAILVLALVNRRPETTPGRIAEFGVIGIAATAASPIAWEHHYGILLPLFAWILPRVTESRKWSGALIAILIAFVFCADDLRMTNLAADIIPLNVIQSTLLSGAFILFFWLRKIVRLRAVPVIQPATEYSTSI